MTKMTGGRLALCGSVLLATFAIAGIGAGGALGSPNINEFSVVPSTTQAGGHPNLDINASFDNSQTEYGYGAYGYGCDCQDVKDITIQFPEGFIGNPHALPECSLLELTQSNCPPESQVGVGTVLAGQQPIYNMEPHPGEAGLVGFNAPIINTPVFLVLSGRTNSDYGLTSKVTGIYHALPISGFTLHLWGVPSDPSHDVNRSPRPQDGSGLCSGNEYPKPCGPPVPFNGPPAVYMENPTSCGQPLSTGLDLLYYDLTEVHADAPWPATTGCDQLSFNPSLTAKPTTTQADTASGLDVDLVVPQAQSPFTPSPSEIRDSTVTLPRGFSINPNAADGKTTCTDEQAAFGTLGPARCPESSKIGTDVLDNVALPAPIPGGIYLGQPQPGNRYRIFLTADGFSTHVKLKGSAQLDPQTGQVTTVFNDLPQSPTQEFDLHYFGSERGLFSTPSQCGTYPVQAEFVPWDSVLPNQTSTSFFTIDSGPNGTPCPPAHRPFDPQLRAGTLDNTAGAHSPFTLQLTRQDGDQNLTGLSLSTPPGFSATLKGIPYCPQAAIDQLALASYSGLSEQASSVCPAASQVGAVTTGTGAGTHPLYTYGKVYLAGPYKGAPISLEAVIPAVSGPYDLGNVAVRTALDIDPQTAQVTAVSDPLPQIIGGVPLRLRSILINLDRQGFALNPTNCDPFSINSTIFGDQGATANPSAHFQVANCADLGFSPKLKIKLSGGTKRNGHPALHATLGYTENQANVKSVAVTLPPSEQIDQSRIGSSCTRAQFAANQCPDNSILGSATAITPLLDKPLTGTVYLVSAGNRLPDLVMALRGQLSVDVHGIIDTTAKGGLRTTFKTVPDVPLSSVTLDVLGAGKGLIVNNTDICKHHAPALAQIDGQNGKSADQKVSLHAPCGKARHRRHLMRARKVG